jgi:2-polyprenyl-3-methyl-5-hydroxy-6-metoxy-1,4-benzoquinol methylase
MINCEDKSWFEDWFNSPYYHMMYANRSNEEADAFIAHLSAKLGIPVGAKLLDLTCGKGRHSKSLSKQGYDVTGVDLSENSILAAKQMEGDHLRFMVHDMRRPVAVNYFDCVVNLFTSFGYFTSVRDNSRTIDAVAMALKRGGVFIIDFLNATKVEQLVRSHPEGDFTYGEVIFRWKKKVANRTVIKEITVKDGEQTFGFCEHVQLLKLSDFEQLLSNKFEIVNVYGDYNLATFDESNSDRLILSCRKK